MIKRIISIFLVLCMLGTMVPVQVFAEEPETTLQQMQEITNPFKDVSESDWYYDSVMYAIQNGLLLGTSDNSFSPEGTMTRAMFVTLLGRIAKIDLTEYENGSTFSDVVPGSYYEPYVQWATEKGITSGIGNGRFDPNELVTREQMATMLVRYFDAYNITYPEATVTTVPNDIDSVAAWARDAVLKLWACGLFVGDNGNFYPGNYAKRSEAASLCKRINEVVEKWVADTGVNTDPANQENPPVPPSSSSSSNNESKGNNSSSGGGGEYDRTTYYKVEFKASEGLTGATMPDGKLYPSGTTISSLPTPYKQNTVFLGWYYDESLTMPAAGSDKITKNISLYAKFADEMISTMELETPNYMTVVDVDTNFTFQIKAPSVEAVKSSLTIKNITANNKVMTYTVSGKSSPFTVTADYAPGETYKAELAEGSDTAFVYNGVQPESIRVFNYITKMDEVLSLSLSSELKYINKDQVSNITGKAFDGLFNLSLKNGTLSADETDSGGTFTYNGGDIAVGDTVAIYSGTKPDQRDLTTPGSAEDGDIAYVIITSIDGTTYSYSPADSKDVLFTPDVLPIPESADVDGDLDNNSVTVASSAVDFSDDKYSSLNLDSQTTVDIGDFIAFYTGDFSKNSKLDSYGKITDVSWSEDYYIIDYEIVTLDEVYAAMDVYHTRNEEIELTEEEIEKIENDLEKQAKSSGFIDEAANYLTLLAMNTDGFRELSDDLDLKSLSVAAANAKDHKLSALSGSRTEVTKKDVVATVASGKVLQHFDGNSGVRAELAMTFTVEISPKAGSEEKIEITVQAIFEQEVLLSVNVKGGAVWKVAWIFPYIYDYQLNANFDIGTYTGIGITATAKTTGPEDDSIGFDWKPAGGTKAEEKIIDIGQQITELMEMKEIFLGEKLVDKNGEEIEWSGSNGGGLAEKYAAMLEEADDSWIEIFRKEIFSVEGSVDPFHILVFGISADFVVSANMYVTMGMTFEYGNAKRYNYSLMLFHKKSTNETIDLEPAHYQFDFYVMGTMGVKAGVEFEVAVGLFSLKLDSIGITAEAGVYAQMWGYFYYHYRWEKGTGGAPDAKESNSAGAMLIEIGAYIEITFKAQLFDNEKFTYQPTLFDQRWPFLTIGSVENVFDFNYGEEKTPSFDIKRVRTFTLPTSLFEMHYMDMQTGEIYGGEDADEEHPAKNYDDETESHFIIEITNKAFQYDPATNTITVVPGENSMKETGEMKITWKNGTLAFTSKPISRTVKLLWDDPATGRYISFDSLGGSPVNMIFAKEGAPITKPEDPKKQGYDFAGWYEDRWYAKPFIFPSTMPNYPEPAKGITVYAKWTPALNNYKVEHYFQELDGKFTLDPDLTQIKKDKRTEEMTAAKAYTISGYTPKPISQEKVAATGSTLIKIYYERNKYTLKFTYGEFSGEENPDIVYTYKYGSNIFAPKLALGGYIFNGWDSEILTTMPARNVTYEAKWIPDPNTPYRVEHYFQNVNGENYTYVSMESRSGETKSTVNCASEASVVQGMTYSHATVDGSEVTSVKIKADGTLVIKLYYNRNTYDVTFDSNGGSEVPKLTGIRYGAAVERPADPVKPGYSFGGWYKDETCSDGNAFDFSLDKMPGENLTLYAKWIPGNYRVTFDANGGSGTTSPQDFIYDVEQALTANGFYRTGYTFAGWNTKSDGSGTPYSDGQVVAKLTTEKSIILYAQWTLNNYTVRFHANDGTETTAEQTFNYNEMNTLSANTFTRVGYTFAGWAESADGPKVYNDKQNVRNLSAENGAIVHLYAKWTANNYIVTFDGNGEGVKGSMAKQSFTYDVKQALRSNSFTRTGYSFAGWNTNAEGTGDSYSDGQLVSNLAIEGNIVLYAIWTGNIYTITLNDEGGIDGSGSVLATYGSDLPDVNIPQKTGYEFQGYYDGQNGTGTCYYSADGKGISPWNKANDTTLYAYWIPRSFTLIFYANGGTVTPQSKTVTFGETYGDLPVPVRSGYTFAGWYTSADGGQKVDCDIIVSIAKDHDIYAHWTANTYTVIFHGNGAGVTGSMANQSFTYDEEAKALTVNGFTRIGYSFDGWATSPTGPKVYDDHYIVGNLTSEKDGQYDLYAVWKANIYTVRFNENGEDVTGTMNDQSFTYDEDAKPLTANGFTRIGYIFGGWAKSPTGSKEYSNSQSVQNLAAENNAVVNLYAVWIPGEGIVYKVNHLQQNVNDDEYTLVNTQELTGTTGAATEARANSYTGFTAKPIVQGTIAGDGTTVINVYYDRDIHYAIWQVNGGTPISDVPYRYSQVIVAPAEPSKEGYNFTGWTWEGHSQPIKTIPETVKMGTADMTFTANWSPITYEVTFNTGGGSTVSNQTIGYKGKVTEPADPTRTGYTFDGWYADETLNVPYNFDEVVSKSHTIYAKWNINIYAVTFDSKDGSAVLDQKVDHGKNAVKPADPTREGYTFIGWYIDEGYGTKYTFNELVIDNLTLYAKWNIKTYTVIFNAKGGSEVEEQRIEHGKKAEVPVPAPAKTGYIFDGWYTEESFNEAYDFDEVVTRNLTLYARWNAISYRVVFGGNGGNITGTTEEQAFVYDEAKNLSANGFARTGYTFDGWNTEANGTGKVYADGASVSNLSAQNGAAVTLYAQWKANQYKVHFEGNGNTGGYMADQTFVYDVAQNLTANGFVKTGYSFSGWNTAVDGSGTTYGPGAQVKNLLTEDGAAMTLYAQWTIGQYTITFKSDSNTVYETITQNYGTPVTVPEDPERLGYSFDGWSMDIPETMPAENITITAKWKPIEYNITYNLDGGVNNPDNPDIYTIVNGFSLLYPTKDAHYFIGWTGTDLSEITRDVTVEAGSIGDRTYNANWEEIGNGVTVIGKNGNVYNLAGSKGQQITLPSTMDDGATVLAWFKDADFKNEITGTYTVTGAENETIYAWLYSSDEPCLIQTKADLILLRDKVNNNSNDGRWRYGHYKVGYQDDTSVEIIVNGQSWTPIGFVNNGKFEGVFDGNRGNDCRIIINMGANVYQGSGGLFGDVGTSGVVKDVDLSAVIVTMNSPAGGIANTNDGTIENCIYSGEIRGYKGTIGGIAGLNGGTIDQCMLGENVIIDALSSNNQYGAEYVGGIAGKNTGQIIGNDTTITGLTIQNVSRYGGGIVGENEGEVSGWIVEDSLITAIRKDASNESGYIGGIAGSNKSGATVTDCGFEDSSLVSVKIVDADFTTTVNEGMYYGGIAGSNAGDISYCTVSGKNPDQPSIGATYTIRNDYAGGGIAGLHNGGSISDCTVYDINLYVSNGLAGGLVGYICNDSSISYCSVEGNSKIDSLKCSGGIIGEAYIDLNEPENPIEYMVSDCTVDATVIVSASRAYPDKIGELVGNLSYHGDNTGWLIDCNSFAQVVPWGGGLI